MAVPARDLRNHYGELLERAASGESIDIEQRGRPVASLGPPRRAAGVPRARLVDVFAHAEPVDAAVFFEDLYGTEGLDDRLHAAEHEGA